MDILLSLKVTSYNLPRNFKEIHPRMTQYFYFKSRLIIPIEHFTGKCSKEPEEQLKEARRASELMGLRDLAYILTNMITGEGYLNKDVEMHFHDRRCQRILDIFVGTGKLAGNFWQFFARKCLACSREP